MSALNVDINLQEPDEIYETLIAAHRNLTAEQSQMLNARLILLLVNHVGDRAVIDAAIARARAGLTSPSTGE